MVQVPESEINIIGSVLNDPKRPLKERFRALFTLKNLGGSFAIEQIEKCFADTSALLKHELAYCLGQMQDSRAIPGLVKVLKDTNHEPMVRHEAGEALGAIGDDSVLPILEEHVKDPVIEVSETCELSIERLKYLKTPEAKSRISAENPYASIDPAPPAEIRDVGDLETLLLDENASLFDRYRAMFSLRNSRTKESTLSLSKGLHAKSALFRHEIAFVLGQLQEAISVPYLIEALENSGENEMVRHECAEALGAIATPECLEVLKKFLGDEKRVVKESCVVALDLCEYENSGEFQYANLLKDASSV